MCIFRKKLVLPHPEEAPDYSQTLENVNIDAVITKWLMDWQVPAEYWDYWRTAIVVTLRTDIDYPAQTYDGADGKRHLEIQPAWLSAGVLAHEQAHNSYALLTESQRYEFAAAYGKVKTSDPLIKVLYSQNAYGLTSDVEGHAEVYRYLGQSMPESLKRFYPKLF